MKKYLKMADAFPHAKVGKSPVKPWVSGEYYAFYENQAEYAAHAINSHDELVAEVERLRGALQDAYIDGCHAGWDMSGEGYNAEHGGPEDGAIHDIFVTNSLEYIK